MENLMSGKMSHGHGRASLLCDRVFSGDPLTQASERSEGARIEIASRKRAIEMNPIRIRGIAKSDKLSVFQRVPSVDAGLSRHGCRTLPGETATQRQRSCSASS